MSSARRHINSTGRKRIKREHVDIRMLGSNPGEPLRAKASLMLDDLGFPPDAIVAIEAYHRSSGMRFDCGRVGALMIPPILTLDEVDRSGSVLFRLKVVDNDKNRGRILGSAEHLQPTSEDDQVGKKSLFPVLYRDLGAEVWKVEIEPGDRPKLILNKEIPGISHRLQHNSLIQGLVLPAALRIVIEALVRDPNDDDDEEPGWKTEWLQFCQSGLGIADDPDNLSPEARIDWMDSAVRRFCETYGFMDSIRKMEGDVV